MTKSTIELGSDELNDLLQTAIITAVRQISFPKKIDPLPEFLTIEQAAILLNLKKSTVYTLVHKKVLPYKKVCKKLYFSQKELIEWIEGKTKNKSNYI